MKRPFDLRALDGLLVIFLLQFSMLSRAQEESVVQGRVLESAGKKPLAGATVTVTSSGDSSFRMTTLTKEDGWFRLRNMPFNDSLLISISYSGYKDFTGILFLREKRFTTAPVELRPAAKELEEVIVKSKTPLILIRKDTIEFKASMVPVPPNSAARDLIRRLPGLYIDPQGKLFFNGRPVSKILVDGKEYYGTDGVVALQNIPVDLIDKIQISGTKTDEQEILGQHSDREQKTLNIKLKQGDKYFVRGTAATGTGDRYASTLFGDRRDKKTTVSVVGGSNNINNTELGSSSVGMLTSGGGITRTTNGAADFTTRFGKKALLQAGYQLNNPSTDQELTRERKQSFVSDSALNTNSVNEFRNKSTEQLFRARINDYGGLNVTGSFRLNRFSNRVKQTVTTTTSNGNLLNRMDNENQSTGDQYNYSATLSYSPKLGKSNNRMLLIGSVFGRHADSEDSSNATIRYYRNGRPDSIAEIRQLINSVSVNRSVTAGITWLRPLSKNWQFSLSYRFSGSWSFADRLTWALDSLHHKRDIDSLFSNRLNSSNSTHGIHVAVTMNAEHWHFQAQLRNDWQMLQQKERLTGIQVLHNQFIPVPEIDLGFGKTEGKWGQYGLNLTSSVTSPTLHQLQPALNNLDPLYRQAGNPGLKPAITYAAMVTMNKLLPKKNLLMNAELLYIPTINNIVSAVTYDSLGNQVGRYRNTNGSFGWSARAGLSKQFKSGPGAFQLQAQPGLTFDKAVMFINDERGTTRTISFVPAISFGWSRAAIVDLTLSYEPSISKLSSTVSAVASQNFVTQSVRAGFTIFAFKLVKWENNLSYNHNNGFAAGFKKSSVLLNSQVNWLLFKNHGEIRLSAFDILRQNRGIFREVSANFIEDSQSNNLQQYFLLGFVFRFLDLKHQAP